MGLPVENQLGYDAGNVLKCVDTFPNSPGRLLIVHGLIDENVHFRKLSLDANSTMVFILLRGLLEPLILAGIDAEIMNISTPSSIHIRACTNACDRVYPPSSHSRFGPRAGDAEHTALFINALVNACKPHQLQVYPQERHGVRGHAAAIHYARALPSPPFPSSTPLRTYTRSMR